MWCCLQAAAQTAADTLRPLSKDSLHYPFNDRRGDRFTYSNRNPFYLSDTGIVKQDIQYDPKTKQYYIIEKIGNSYYRKPTYLSFDEFWKLQNQRAEEAYFNERAKTLDWLNRRAQRPPMQVYNTLFDRIFGLDSAGLKVSIKPQGNVDIRLGYQGQNIKNPTLSERARKNGGFDFDMDANMNVMANIGNKLKLPINYNTLANFDFENQLKLDYKGKDDEILKSIEAGNISFQTKGTLMSSVQSLFGLKTQLQFGRLFITAALANERSQKQSITLQGGGLSQQINKRLDDYDENRNFLMAQYFRKNFNNAMRSLPVVNSQIQIQRIEVWVTNHTGTTTQARDVVGFMDLGENQPYNQNIHSITSESLPQNNANDLYSFLTASAVNRNPSAINSVLVAKGLKPVEDYEKTFARQLSPNEYFFNPQVGFISLYQQLQPDEVLAVAYQYSYNGRVYQVGEFSQDVAVDSSNQGVQKVLFLKLLKATSQRVNLPIWQLMMKNVYSLDMSGVSQEDFNLNVFYQEPSGGQKRYLPEGDQNAIGTPLISILRADRLNNRNDPMPDGQYDYVDSFTVLSQQGKIIFPVLEPFGKDLDSFAFSNQPPNIKDKYVYYQLYDSIKAIAQTYANLNRYVLYGTVKGSSNTDIYLGGFNIPQGSVVVTAGGQILQENSDYTVDYNLGTLKIINQAIINSGVPVNVQFENNATFNIQQRSFIGLRADYLVNKNLSLGATMEKINERPYFTKMNYGEDPISNSMYGVDFNYRAELPGLTRLLDKLPFYTTTAASNINAYGEAALLKPGHPQQIGKGNNGLIYIDDFEGSTSNVDLRYPLVSWTLASTPQGTARFPEATLTNDLAYGKNRAKLAWYNIEPVLQDKNSPSNPLRRDLNALSDPRVRPVYTNELFPQRTTNITDVQSTTFDMAYYPTDPGPYNYETNPSEISGSGKLLNPQKRWGGIMRSIDQTDFVTSNVQFIEFWIQDPFIKNPTSTGGKLVINLGNISEDILKDGRRFYENGLSTPTQPATVDTSSVWGKTPVNPIQVTNAFSNDPADRPYQDVGFDGLTDDSEKIVRRQYLQDIATNFGTASALYQRANTDPSNDDYLWYRDSRFDAANAGIQQRYKNFNNPQGNSPVATNASEFSPAATLYPDNEDLNRDNTLNETEEYYEYDVELKPGMDVGLTKYITDKRLVKAKLANGAVSEENWYLFRVPIDEYTAKVGNIPDFKSIRFIRMYMTGFEDSVVLRFATMDLVRNQWRNFTYELDTTGAYTQLPENSKTNFDVLAVNLEENSARYPVPYKIPPGIERVQALSNNGINLLQNEQSMSLRVQNLTDGDARAVFKTLNLDMRQYGELSMFIHAESLGIDNLQDGQVNAVVRIGQDFLNNYYEVKIPLKITRWGASDPAIIWPEANNLDFALSELVNLKIRRNSSNAPINTIYREVIDGKTFSVMGNPNLGEVRGFLIGVENPKDGSTSSIGTEVWINELRLSHIDERGGYAALGRVDMQLADLGTLSVSANTYSTGWGGIEQRVNERALNSMVQYDAALEIDAGRLLPKKAGITIPVYASINKTIMIPEYDPYDMDVKYKYKLANSKNRDSVRKAALDQMTVKTINFTNVRFAQPTGNPKLWSLSNFDFTYSFTQIQQSTPIINKNDIRRNRGGFGYTYNGNARYKEPFKRLIRNNSPWFALVRDFNYNLNPSLLSFRADIDRQFGEYVPRIVNTYDSKVERVDTTYDKYFTFDRYYNARWDLTRSLNFDFSAINNARIDEPFGKLDSKSKKDSIWRNFLKGGRNTLYQQKATLSYNLPLSKLPITDWITARYSYSATYNWIGASLLPGALETIGNTLENSQQNNFNGEFDFTRLYSKSRWLNAVNTPAAPKAPSDNENESGTEKTRDSSQRTRAEVVKGLKGRKKKEALRAWRRQKRETRKAMRQANFNQPMEVSGLARTGGQLLTMVKRASVNYSENYYSRVPGYTDSTRLLGQNFNTMQPGLDYVFGRQPDTSWLNQKAREGVITKSDSFNILFRQTYEQRLSITASLEPIPELNIDINLERSFSKDYSELFKDTTGTGANFGHLSPYASGGFSVSYISFQTLFGKHRPNEISETFTKFEANRQAISKRLAANNKYYNGGTTADGFAAGYGRYSQDVLIPAFLAAYTGKSTDEVMLIKQSNTSIKQNPFSGLKALPNWRVTYTGLTKIPALANVFSSISLTHGYNSTVSMNSFTSALNYYDPLHYGSPGFIDTVSGNFVPFFLVPNLTIQEQFSPLIGIDVTTTNQTNFNFQFIKSRQLSLSLVDYQLSEVNSTQFVIGASIRKKNVNLPFKLPGFKKLDPNAPTTSGLNQGNDLNLRLDFSIRDDAQSNSRLDQPTSYSTGGQKVISIQPSLDYVLNSRVNIQLYFDQQRTIPYISTSAPITTTRAGLLIRISLAQ
ncbi:cell surface protein SprA [Ilyomonas limi]|uniref:Cell surface protein SprA n=1 Tax=Ilyomonas limi TaxID=2575867 RepID=A0A4U3L2T1_9BACT|nr:cell surface protein SprA [Ilyomonas limi]